MVLLTSFLLGYFLQEVFVVGSFHETGQFLLQVLWPDYRDPPFSVRALVD